MPLNLQHIDWCYYQQHPDTIEAGLNYYQHQFQINLDPKQTPALLQIILNFKALQSQANIEHFSFIVIDYAEHLPANTSRMKRQKKLLELLNDLQLSLLKPNFKLAPALKQTFQYDPSLLILPTKLFEKLNVHGWHAKQITPLTIDKLTNMQRIAIDQDPILTPNNSLDHKFLTWTENLYGLLKLQRLLLRQNYRQWHKLSPLNDQTIMTKLLNVPAINHHWQSPYAPYQRLHQMSTGFNNWTKTMNHNFANLFKSMHQITPNPHPKKNTKPKK